MQLQKYVKMTHKDYLLQAFLLSKQADPKQIRPNPFVGALVVDENKNVIGKGFHQKKGEPHAEVFAINEALTKLKDLSNSTLYVTLEPCSHYGKTPPCSSLILKHNIKKVVIAMQDPNTLVNGIEILCEQKVEVLIEELNEVKQLNQTFIINQKLKRPKFFLKTACTLDGYIADRNLNSKWLSNEKSREYAHQFLRNRVDAILTTYKTILLDNASFNIRTNGNIKEQNLIIIDRNLEILNQNNETLNIFYERTHTKIYLITDKNNTEHSIKNLEIIKGIWKENKLDLIDLSNTLFAHNFYEILIEAGGKLNATVVENNLHDECWIYFTPKILNDTLGIKSFNIEKENSLINIKNLQLIETLTFDDDVLIKYQKQI